MGGQVKISIEIFTSDVVSKWLAGDGLPSQGMIAGDGLPKFQWGSIRPLVRRGRRVLLVGKVCKTLFS